MGAKSLTAALLACGVVIIAWQYAHRPGPVFQTAPVERGDMQSIVASTGTVSSLVTVLVGTQVSGTVKKMYADFNSSVHKGDLLADIDPDPFIAKLTVAKAALESAEASVDTAKAGVEKARSDIQSAKQQEENQKSQMDLAKSAEAFAKLQADRAAQSAKAEVGTVSDQSAAQAAYEVAAESETVAEAQAEAAEVAVEVDEAAYQAALTQVTTANAEVRQAEGAVEQAQLDLDHTKIISPTDGIVLSRDVDLGQTVAASFSAPTLFEIAQDLTQMQVDANIDQADITKIMVGEDATFTVDALPNVTYRTKVAQIRENPINIQNVTTYDVVLRVANPDLRLFPGMTTNVRLQTAVHNGVLMVPSAALRFQPKGAKSERDVHRVYMLDAGNQPTPRKVQTGITDGRFVEITAGDLHEGDAVIESEVRPK